MQRVKNNNSPTIFKEKFKFPGHKYPTNFSQNSFVVLKKT